MGLSMLNGIMTTNMVFFPKLYVKDMWKDNKWTHKVNIIIDTKDRFIDIRNGKDFRLLTSKQAENKYLSDLIKSGLVERC